MEEMKALTIKLNVSHDNLHRNVLSQDDMRSLLNCGLQNLKWKERASSLATMTQTKNQSEHVRDSKCCDLMINNAQGPLKEGSSDVR